MYLKIVVFASRKDFGELFHQNLFTVFNVYSLCWGCYLTAGKVVDGFALYNLFFYLVNGSLVVGVCKCKLYILAYSCNLFIYCIALLECITIDDGGEQVVEFVGDGGGHSADGLQALPVCQGLLLCLKICPSLLQIPYKTWPRQEVQQPGKARTQDKTQQK